MKKNIAICSIFICLLFGLTINSLSAQDPGSYMSAISKEFDDITADMWDYTSSVAHGKSARKVEQKRKDVLKSNLDAQNKIQKLGDFEGDKSLKDSVLSFLRISHHVINYDYGKIVDMEEIAEQSYDDMEAYLTAQEKANEKLEIAGDMMDKEQVKFAASHNVKLLQNTDKTSKKLEVAGKVFEYYNKIYLIFFKPYKQELYMLDALNKNDINSLKQNADALANYSKEGLQKLDTLKAYKGDSSLKLASKELLTFYQTESTTKAPILINFYVKKENFDKLSAAFDKKTKSERTKELVDEFNKAVSDFNKTSNEFNDLNNELNTKRNNLITKWNNVATSLLDKHVPKYK